MRYFGRLVVDWFNSRRKYMVKIGAYDAKTHLSEILQKVAQGEHFIITRNGMPLAQLIPVAEKNREGVQSVIDKLKSLRKGKTTGKLRVRDMIAEGRRR